MFDPKVTLTDIQINPVMMLDKCCEKDCGIPVLIDKNHKNEKVRCTACTMRAKISEIMFR